jgi:hypothetical protein
LLDGRVAELLCWAEENGFNGKDVKAALKRKVEAEATNDGNGTIARPAVAEIVGERKSPPETLGGSIPQRSKIPGTSMAPHQKKKSQTTPSSKSNTGKLSSHRKKVGKETGLGENTKNMIHDFVNPHKVSNVYVLQLHL